MNGEGRGKILRRGQVPGEDGLAEKNVEIGKREQ